MQAINHQINTKTLHLLLSLLLSILLSCNTNAIVYEPKPELKSEILSKMEDFCTKAGGSVTTFENTCGNSCIIYDRKTGEKLKNIPSQCKADKIYSCNCPPNQCLQYGKCQTTQNL